MDPHRVIFSASPSPHPAPRPWLWSMASTSRAWPKPLSSGSHPRPSRPGGWSQGPGAAAWAKAWGLGVGGEAEKQRNGENYPVWIHRTSAPLGLIFSTLSNNKQKMGQRALTIMFFKELFKYHGLFCILRVKTEYTL